ncbi:MAG: DNA translocase FtsK [Candidatus Omnitrophica bacterium]|nr:DNA translocase FtsK [Candidatus Omnitrophota bacterium]MBU1809345.1 DNA translocase FtsK [Candidatus Omnitrophota bacterium]
MKKDNNGKVQFHNKWNEVQAVLLFAASLLIFISLVSFSFNDLKQFTSSPNAPVGNYAGLFGAYFGSALFFIMGMSSYVIPLLVLSWAIARLYGITPQKVHFKIFGTFFLILASSSLFSIMASGSNSFRFSLGGIVGLVFSDFLIKYLGKAGAILVIAVLFLLSLLLATEFLLLPFLSALYRKLKGLPVDIKEKVFSRPEAPAGVVIKKPVINISSHNSKDRIIKDLRKESPPRIITAEAPQNTRAAKTAVEQSSPRPVTSISVTSGEASGYKLPGLDLLDPPPPLENRKIKEDFESIARILEETLRDFDIEGKVVEINKGPVITRYELEPAPGVKVHRITSLSDNIALAMKAQSVRIVAPIPGKGTIGFEVPNSTSALVFLREVLDSKEYRENRSALKLALGKDIAGVPVIADLAKMPHLLIAGATGSGKTVCVNSAIISLLFNLTPDDVKFIMVDPKRVELAVFNGLPHLLSPVVTDVKKVASTLAWVVGEMDSRYELFAKSGVRNIALYNDKYKNASLGSSEGSIPVKLPYIVVVIDELADLMMVAREDVESTITRLAQLSRAVGIHMIIATQRPSVDVITGIIKANFPARISFKVASKVDSRTVLDMNGADMLLGRGDMLLIEPGTTKPVRAQCSLISDKEIERITGFIKAQREPHYVDDIMEVQKKLHGFKKFDKDEVYEEAVKLILESKQASVSVLQRRLGLGYTRAARLIDMMEDEGIVGPYQGSKPRDLLVTLEEYQIKNGG